jgi:hypothetical protein
MFVTTRIAAVDLLTERLPPSRVAGLYVANGRGLHSSTFRLNLSAFCGIRVYLGVVEGV